MRAELGRLQAEHQQVTAEKRRREQELAVIRHGSEHLVRLTEERSALQREVASLARRAADLDLRNLDLRNETGHRWFLIGAGVLTGGILIGPILPQLRLRRRKAPWSSL